jgi:hypothetical protein
MPEKINTEETNLTKVQEQRFGNLEQIHPTMFISEA